MKKDKFKIIKVPLKQKSKDIYPNFPPMPVLYLELLENKEKIKPELRNKDYVPIENEDVQIDVNNSTNLQDNIKEDISSTQVYKDMMEELKFSSNENKERFDYDLNRDKEKYSKYDFSDRFTPESNSKKDKYEDNYERKDYERKDYERQDYERKNKYKEDYERKNKYKEDYDRKYKYEEDDRKYKYEEDYDRKDKYEEDDRKDNYEEDYDRKYKYEEDDIKDKYEEDDRKDKYEEDYERKYKRNKKYKQDRYDYYNVKDKYKKKYEEDEKENTNREKYKKYDYNSNDNHSDDKLKNIISGKYEERTDRSLINTKNDSSIDKTQLNTNENQKTNIPPRLSEIDQGNVNFKANPLNYTKINRPDEDETNKKRELLFRFDILKRSYKGSNIPEYSEYTDLITLQKSYDDTVRRLSLDSNVENYKKYLIGGFMAVEYVFGMWFKFDMKGFTQQQMVSMNSYERLLIELGEKSYIEAESSWPVEARLLSMIIINAVVFIVSKMVFNKTGANLLNMMNSVSNFGFGGGSNSNNSNVKNEILEEENNPHFSTKKKMKGPNVNVNEFSFVSEEDKKKKE